MSSDKTVQWQAVLQQLEGPVGVDNVHVGRGLTTDDILGQLRDGIHEGAVNKLGKRWVKLASLI